MAGNKFNLNSLLNSTSKSAARQDNEQEKPVTQKSSLKVIPISVHSLIPSKDNFYSVEQIEELKSSIELFGIKQNLIVRPLEDGKYKLIAGHRRRLASLALVEEGKMEYEYVPCAIEPGKDEILERLLLITTNATVRQLSDWEKVEQVKEMRALLEEYKKNEKLPGRVRDLIAQALNTSPTQIGRMDAIEKNLSPEFKEEFKGGGINMSTAYELSGLPEEKQKEAHREYQEKGGLSINDVKQKKAALQNTRPAKPAKPPEQPQEGQQEQQENCGFQEINLNPCNSDCETCQSKAGPPAEEPNKETVFDAMRKMDPEQLADFLAKEMIAAFEWDMDPVDILEWLNKPMKEG
jgi:ParB family chromosome partitioning protein